MLSFERILKQLTMNSILKNLTKSLIKFVIAMAMITNLQAEELPSPARMIRNVVVNHLKYQYGSKEKVLAKLLQNIDKIYRIFNKRQAVITPKLAIANLINNLTGEENFNDSNKVAFLKTSKHVLLLYLAYLDSLNHLPTQNHKRTVEYPNELKRYIISQNNVGFYLNFSDFKPELKPDFAKTNPQDLKVKRFLSYLTQTVKYS